MNTLNFLKHRLINKKYLFLNNFYTIKWINFEFCSYCNLKCKWCILDHSKEKVVMKPECLEKVLQEIIENKKFKIETIDLHNAGETLLHPQLDLMLNIIAEKRKLFKYEIKVNLLSNGVPLNEEITNIILNSNALDFIRFSVDGGTRENYEEIRKGVKWEVIENKLKYFIKKNNEHSKKIKTGIICIIPPEKEYSFEWMSAEFRQLLELFDHIELRYPHNWDGSKELGLNNKNNVVKEKICKFLLKNLVVLPNGDVTVCCADLNSRGVIGNVYNNTLEEIYFSKKRIKMLKNYIGNKDRIDLCRNCGGYYE